MMAKTTLRRKNSTMPSTHCLKYPQLMGFKTNSLVAVTDECIFYNDMFGSHS
jgi:hypothetical protein